MHEPIVKAYFSLNFHSGFILTKKSFLHLGFESGTAKMCCNLNPTFVTPCIHSVITLTFLFWPFLYFIIIFASWRPDLSLSPDVSTSDSRNFWYSYSLVWNTHQLIRRFCSCYSQQSTKIVVADESTGPWRPLVWPRLGLAKIIFFYFLPKLNRKIFTCPWIIGPWANRTK